MLELFLVAASKNLKYRYSHAIINLVFYNFDAQ